MLKTFFEKVPVKDGDVLVNYTSAVKDATLERLYRYTISRFDTSKVIAEQDGFTSLIQARVAAWNNLGKMIKPLTPVACHDNDRDVIEELEQNEHTPLAPLYNTIYDGPPSEYEREHGEPLPKPPPNIEPLDFPEGYRDINDVRGGR